MSPDLLLQLKQRLDQHDKLALTRKRKLHSSHNVLDFTSNQYLALTQTQQNTAALQASGSPITYYTTAHQALEQRLQEWLNYPRALLFTSGYLAVLSAMTALIGPDDFVAVDKQCHASVFDALQLCKASWQRYQDDDRLKTILEKNNHRLRFIVTSSVFSMQGHLADLKKLTQIAQQYDATLIIDDVHGTGVLGPQGQGAVAHWNLSETPLMIGSFTKGLGGLGAFVAGNDIMIEAILQFGRPYMFSTTLPPHLVSLNHEALDLAAKAHDKRAHLQALIAHFQHKAKQLDLNILPSETAIQAIVYPNIQQLMHITQQLAEKNILVGAIRPPTVPKESPRLRISLRSAHQLEDIDRLFEELKSHE